MRASPIVGATELLEQIFQAPVTIVRNQAEDSYRILFEPGYFLKWAERAVDEAWEKNGERK
jgi:hypothetical protein